ncbi:MAG: ABC transporter ATP-binding protein [Tannerellaceae bacterium]|jgi:ABC-2 type transport system ATP-binding protein|nr:ABC transporter ATP-binding protein [Tannerellaceae bacterium]
MNVIETEKITKKFKTLTALDNISIRVGEGEIYGFLGLNGAGKTTLIRILLAMIKPTGGMVKIFGNKPDTNNGLWNNIGYMVEKPSAYPNLSVIENLAVYFELRQLKNKKLIGDIIEKLNLGNYADTKAKYLSLGNGQRLGLAKALMHSPKLLILDEPINGLDPEGIVEVRKLLKELSLKGTTIFLSSHILGEISKLANRIAIIHRGKLIKELSAGELDGKLIKKLLIKTNENERALQYLNQKNYNAAIVNNEIETTDIRAIEKPEEISKLLVEKGLPAKQVYLFTEDLEHYFLRAVGECGNEQSNVRVKS